MPERKRSPKDAAPATNQVKRTGRAGERGSALAENVLNQDRPTTSPGAVTPYGRQPRTTPPAKIDAGEDDPRTPPVTKDAPKPSPHWRSKP